MTSFRAGSPAISLSAAPAIETARAARLRSGSGFLFYPCPTADPRRRDSVAPPDHAKKAPSGKASFPDGAFYDPFLVLLGASNKLFQDISESAKGKRIRLGISRQKALFFPGARSVQPQWPDRLGPAGSSAFRITIGFSLSAGGCSAAPAPVSGQLSNRPG